MTSKLTVPQQQQVRELAAIGVLLFDALVSLGFSPTEADEMCQDNEIIDSTVAAEVMARRRSERHSFVRAKKIPLAH